MKNIIIEPTKHICKKCNKIKKYPIKNGTKRFYCDICGEDTEVYTLKTKYE